MSFWEDFKNLFKTRQQLEKEKHKKLKDAKEKSVKIENQLEDLHKLYNRDKKEDKPLNVLFPEDSRLKKIEYIPSTDEEIKELANSIFEGDYEDKKNLENSKYQNKENELIKKKNDSVREREQDILKIRNAFKNHIENAKDEAVKNGISRSSILNNNIDDLVKAGKQSEGNLTFKYQNKLNLIDNNLKKLKKDRDDALSALNLKFAGDVKEKIDSLTKERAKLVRDYQLYNDRIREKQQNYNIEREKKINKYLDEKKKAKNIEFKNEMKNGYSGAKKDNYDQRFAIAEEFYNSLPTDIAVDALEASPNMKYYLGIYYKILHDSLEKKKI